MADIKEGVGKSLNDTLRYYLPGVTFVIAMITAFDDPLARLTMLPKDYASLYAAVFLAVVAVLGAGIYSVNRACPVFVVGWMFTSCYRSRWPEIMRDEVGAGDGQRREVFSVFLVVISIVCVWSYQACCLFFTNMAILPYKVYAISIPCILLVLLSICFLSIWFPDFYKNVIYLDIKRWKNQKNGFIQERLSEWASQVHFVYGVAWSGLFAIDTGLALGFQRSEVYFFYVLIASVGVLCFGLMYHLRYLRWELEVFSSEAEKQLELDADKEMERSIRGYERSKVMHECELSKQELEGALRQSGKQLEKSDLDEIENELANKRSEFNSEAEFHWRYRDELERVGGYLSSIREAMEKRREIDLRRLDGL